ncbi:MAG: hypothetical protein JKY12_03930 [Sneathiella sp.]|nr:hypothetical protein [Sneathiella sp.]
MSVSDSDKVGENSRQDEVGDKLPFDSARTDTIVSTKMEDTGKADQSASEDTYDVGFMMQEHDDQDELVDLDSLFDALNIAAEEGVDAIGYVSGSDDQVGVLTVTNEALAVAGVSASMDDVSAVTGNRVTDSVISDES